MPSPGQLCKASALEDSMANTKQPESPLQMNSAYKKHSGVSGTLTEGGREVSCKSTLLFPFLFWSAVHCHLIPLPYFKRTQWQVLRVPLARRG